MLLYMNQCGRMLVWEEPILTTMMLSIDADEGGHDSQEKEQQ